MKELLERLVAAIDDFQQRHRWTAFPVAVVRKASDDQGASLAVVIAYYGLLAVFPLMLVFASVLGFLLAGNNHLEQHVLHSAESSFPALSGYIDSTVAGSKTAISVGLTGALWAGLGVTRATEKAMNAVWDIPLADRPNLWWSRLRGLGMLGILGVTFLFSTALASLPKADGAAGLAVGTVGVAGSFALNVALYLLAFQVLTNKHLKWRSVLPGALAGAVGWTALLNVGAFYVRHEIAHASRLYGSISVVIAMLAWIYLGAQLTIYAAEVNVVHDRRLWPRSLRRSATTEADRRAFIFQAEEAKRNFGESIVVSFQDEEL